MKVAVFISEDDTDGDADVIDALSGSFSVKVWESKLFGSWAWFGECEVPPDHWFGCLHAYVG